MTHYRLRPEGDLTQIGQLSNFGAQYSRLTLGRTARIWKWPSSRVRLNAPGPSFLAAESESFSVA